MSSLMSSLKSIGDLCIGYLHNLIIAPLRVLNIKLFKARSTVLMKFVEDRHRKLNFMGDFKCPDTLTRDYRRTHRRNVEKYRGLVNNATEWNSSIETFIVSSNGVVPKWSLGALKSLEYLQEKLNVRLLELVF